MNAFTTNLPPRFGSSFSQPSQQPVGWWVKNSKWLTRCLILILTVVAVGVGIYLSEMSAAKSSVAYQRAIEKAMSNPTVIEAMGGPFDEGLLLQGSVKTGDGKGLAWLQIPINGPKNSGTIYAEAWRDPVAFGNYDWHFTTLEVEIEGRSERITLSPKGLPPPLSLEADIDRYNSERNATYRPEGVSASF